MAVKASRKTQFLLYILSFLLLAAILGAPAAEANASSNTILINEVLYDPEGTDLGYEWIELINISDDSINLGGWKIQAAGAQFTDVITIPEIIIESGEIILIGEPNIESDITVSKLAFQNGGTESDGIKLLNKDGEVADTLVYDEPNTNNLIDDTGNISANFAQDTESGNSLCRINSFDTDHSDLDFIVCKTPTPGKLNTFAPIASIEFEEPIFVNESTIFDASSSSDPDGEIQKYAWKIDGKNYLEEEQTINFMFETIGEHTIELTIIDNSDLMSNITQTINVYENPDNPTITKISQFKNLETGETASIKGIVTASPGLIYENEGYIQDYTGGIRFKMPPDTIIQKNKTYIFTGRLGTSYGEKRLTVEKIIPNDDVFTISPYLITTELDLERNIGNLVKVEGKINKKVGNYMYVQIGQKEVKVFLSESMLLSLPENLKNEAISVTGIASQYGNTEEGKPKIKICPLSSKDINIGGQVLAAAGYPIIIFTILLPIVSYYTVRLLKKFNL